MKDENLTFQLMLKLLKTIELMQFYIEIECTYAKYTLLECEYCYYRYCNVLLLLQHMYNLETNERQTTKKKIENKGNSETETLVAAVDAIISSWLLAFDIFCVLSLRESCAY